MIQQQDGLISKGSVWEENHFKGLVMIMNLRCARGLISAQESHSELKNEDFFFTFPIQFLNLNQVYKEDKGCITNIII